MRIPATRCGSEGSPAEPQPRSGNPFWRRRMPSKTQNIVLAGYLDEPSFGRQIKKQLRTAQEWRRSGKGPPVTWIGRTPYYRVESVQSWLLQRERTPPRERVGRRQSLRNANV